jgi:hypothetical protein
MDVMGLVLVLAIAVFLIGCDDDDNCDTDISGCDSDFYSCPAADNCYYTESACSSSGECDD